jgi:hypothetical protein
MQPEQPRAPWPVYPLEEPEGGTLEAYASIVDTDWSLTDVTLRFLQLAFVPKENQTTATNREMILLERANITIPWWSTKILAGMLGELVKSYESVNGELKAPVLAPRPAGGQSTTQPPSNETEQDAPGFSRPND